MSDLSFAGKTVVVTGGASGIGAAAARLFHAHGAIVFVLDRAASPDLPGHFLEVDVTDSKAVDAAFSEVARSDGIDHLVVCAGIARDNVLWKLTEEEWDAVVDVNLKGAFLCLRAVTPHLRSRGRGSVVLVSSINGERGKFGQSNYAASKAGLMGLAKSAARELGRFQVRVNVVAPGMTDTPLTRSLPESVRAAAVSETLLGRSATPEDVAGPILFLCSDLARHVTGQVLRVDGGQYL